jgi:hypothetical protein
MTARDDYHFVPMANQITPRLIAEALKMLATGQAQMQWCEHKAVPLGPNLVPSDSS